MLKETPPAVTGADTESARLGGSDGRESEYGKYNNNKFFHN